MEDQGKKYIGYGQKQNRVVESVTLGTGSWVKIEEVKYKYINPETKEEKLKTWEVIQRTTTPKGELVSGVSMIPILIDGDKRHLLVISNYRAPLDKFVLEFPGGLLDEGETLETAALRELKEETGYTAQRIKPNCVSFVGYSSPWFSSENGQSFILEVELDHEDNKVIEKNLDPGEVIENVIIEDIDNGSLMEKVASVVQEGGLAMTSDLINFINGFEVARSMLGR